MKSICLSLEDWEWGANKDLLSYQEGTTPKIGESHMTAVQTSPVCYYQKGVYLHLSLRLSINRATLSLRSMELQWKSKENLKKLLFSNVPETLSHLEVAALLTKGQNVSCADKSGIGAMGNDKEQVEHILFSVSEPLEPWPDIRTSVLGCLASSVVLAGQQCPCQWVTMAELILF